jgi:hypothetical protein
MTISPKALKDRRGSLVTQVITTVKKTLNIFDYLDPGIVGGLDTDFYLGPWNPEVAKNLSVMFAFIRAGEYVIDPQFENSWTKSAGLFPRGAYWYVTKDPTKSINSQARDFSSLFPKGYDGELPIVLDFEEDEWFGKGRNRTHLGISDCVSFCIDFKSYMPSWNGEVMIYSNFNLMLNWGGYQFFRNPIPAPITKIHYWHSNPPPTKDKYNPIMGKLPQPEFVQTDFVGDGVYYGGESKDVDLDAYVGHSFDSLLRKG